MKKDGKSFPQARPHSCGPKWEKLFALDIVGGARQKMVMNISILTYGV